MSTRKNLVQMRISMLNNVQWNFNLNLYVSELNWTPIYTVIYIYVIVFSTQLTTELLKCEVFAAELPTNP